LKVVVVVGGLKFNPTTNCKSALFGIMLNLVEQHNRILCVMLKPRDTLIIDINVENSGENAQSVLEREVQETPRTNAVEETTQSP
jgi:hypothetical protein